MADRALKMKCKQIVLASTPTSVVTESHFRVDETETEVDVRPGSNDVAVKLLYIGVEPLYRHLMHEEDDAIGFGSYTVGQPIWGFAVAQVVMSANLEFEKGDTVQGNMQFSEYTIVPKGQGTEKVDGSQAPLSYYLGVLGMPGFTAYLGFKVLGKPKSGDEVFVSGAASAIGQIVGQLAKVYGCRAVGSAGSDQKVEMLKDFGFDDAFNYKKEKDFNAALKKYCPNGIDIYFDNVGGEILDAVLMNCNPNARISVCGAISQYNLEEEKRYGMKNLLNLVFKNIKMEGFVDLEGKFAGQYLAQYRQEMSTYLKEGKVKYKEHVSRGIEQFPAAFVGLMLGHNISKSVVYV